jgi:hypothetical protein
VKLSRRLRAGAMVGTGPAGAPPRNTRAFEVVASDAMLPPAASRPTGALALRRDGGDAWVLCGANWWSLILIGAAIAGTGGLKSVVKQAHPRARVYDGVEPFVFDADLRWDALQRVDAAVPVVITVPTDAEAAIEEGSSWAFQQVGAGSVTFTPAAGVALEPPVARTIAARYAAAELIKVAPNTWTLIGALV